MDIFSALSDPTRRDIIELLARHGKMPAADIVGNFSVSGAAISQHLKVLKEARVVEVEKKAQQRIYYINPNAMLDLEDWARQTRLMWEERFDRLDKLLEEQKRIKNTS